MIYLLCTTPFVHRVCSRTSCVPHTVSNSVFRVRVRLGRQLHRPFTATGDSVAIKGIGGYFMDKIAETAELGPQWFSSFRLLDVTSAEVTSEEFCNRWEYFMAAS